MREILFRGKRNDSSEWVYGNFVRGCVDDFAYIVEFGNKELCRNYVEVIPETVGQYTGLTDKNGKKIFEGDIVSEMPPMNSVSYIGYVVWDEEATLFRVVFGNPSNCCILGTYSRSYTVIGNIYDNPELLKEGDESDT